MKEYTGETSGNRICISDSIVKGVSMPEAESFAFDISLNDIKAAIEEAKVYYSNLSHNEELSKVSKELVEAYKLLLEDDELYKRIENMCYEGSSVSDAFITTRKELINLFSASDDLIFNAKADDVRDLFDKIEVFLRGEKKTDCYTKKGVYFFEELLPSYVLELDRTLVDAVILRKGSLSSHAVLLLNALNIPFMIIPDFVYSTEESSCSCVIIDEAKKKILISPEEDILNEYKKAEDISMPFDKACSLKCKLFVNIVNIEEAEKHADVCDGIGLYRTELSVLNKKSFPTREELFDEYTRVLELYKDKPVVIRLFDIAPDKLPQFVSDEGRRLVREGKRGISFLLYERELLKIQLEALLLANKDNLRILVPFIKSIEEIDAFFELIRELVHKCGIKVIPKFGCMIETVESVELLDELSERFDFASVGTNDLFSELKGVSRDEIVGAIENGQIESELRKALERSVCAFKSKEKDISVCGEIASNEIAVRELLNMEISGISVAGPSIFKLRNKLSLR